MNTVQEIVVRKHVTVPLEPARAFELFTTRMDDFWPRSHTISEVPRADIVLEAHAGGRWYELGTDGSACVWGEVAEWQPPSRLGLVWQIDADWNFDPQLRTEVEIDFVPTAEGCRVELAHRHLERFGDRALQMADVFDRPGAWQGILDAFATVTRRR